MNTNKTSLILSCLGSVGVVCTGISAAIQTPKALTRLENLEEGSSKVDKALVAMPCYISTILMGLASISCIFAAHKYNEKVQKAMISAYALIDGGYSTYRDIVCDMYGSNRDSDVIDKMAYGQASDIVLFNDEELFYDEFSGRYFKSTFEELDNAMSEVNQIFEENGYLELNCLYDILGLESTDYGFLIGWSERTLYAHGHTSILYRLTSILYRLEEARIYDGGVYHKIIFNERPSMDFEYQTFSSTRK